MASGSIFKGLLIAATSLGGLAAITLTILAIITGFKDSGKVSNTTADLFAAGVTLFGTFSSILVLAIIGKTIIGMFKKMD